MYVTHNVLSVIVFQKDTKNGKSLDFNANIIHFIAFFCNFIRKYQKCEEFLIRTVCYFYTTSNFIVFEKCKIYFSQKKCRKFTTNLLLECEICGNFFRLSKRVSTK